MTSYIANTKTDQYQPKTILYNSKDDRKNVAH